MAVTLNSLVGSLLSEVAVARSLSDAQTVELAAAYRSDPLLRQLPVPRVEIGEVQFDLKVAVVGLDGEGQTLVEADANALQEMRPETLSSLRVVAKVQNYALQNMDDDSINLIPLS